MLTANALAAISILSLLLNLLLARARRRGMLEEARLREENSRWTNSLVESAREEAESLKKELQEMKDEKNKAIAILQAVKEAMRGELENDAFSLLHFIRRAARYIEQRAPKAEKTALEVEREWLEFIIKESDPVQIVG